MDTPLLVGVDPGSTSAVAAIDLEGEIKLLESRKNFPKEEIIKSIIQVGKPVLVTSDKEKLPGTVDKISTSLGVRSFEPKNDLSQEKKKELGIGENSHECDASASCFYAKNMLNDKIKKINNIEDKYDQKKYKIAKKILKKEDLVFKTSSQNDEEREKKTANEKTGEENVDKEKKRLEKKIENLDEYSEELKTQLKTKESEIKRLNSKIKKLHKEERYKIRKEEEISRLRAENDKKQNKIQELEKEIKNLKSVNKSYKKAITQIYFEERELIPIVRKKIENTPEKIAIRDRALLEHFKEKECKIYKLSNLEGISLENFYLMKDYHETKNFESIITNYKESR